MAKDSPFTPKNPPDKKVENLAEREDVTSAKSVAATDKATMATGSNVNTTLPPDPEVRDRETGEITERPSAVTSRLVGDIPPNTVSHPMGTLVEEVKRNPSVRGSVQTLLTGVAIKILQFRENPGELTRIAQGLLNGQFAISKAVLDQTSAPLEDKPEDVTLPVVERLSKAGQ